MMLDIRMDVPVVRMRGGEVGIIRVRLRVVPVEQLAILPDLIAILANPAWRVLESQPFAHVQADALVEFQLASQDRHGRAATNHHQGRAPNGCKLAAELVDERLVVSERL
ncbi:hypothetical protein CKO27_23385 [Thiocystis violacea]|nr:hypothetical protein [Thiocystis violacea]